MQFILYRGLISNVINVIYTNKPVMMFQPIPKKKNVGLASVWGVGRQLHVYETQIPPAASLGLLSVYV